MKRTEKWRGRNPAPFFEFVENCSKWAAYVKV
nr:MAG TPA: hypothetical protein [Caudoviricetes sp.]